ncbi:hypothetical protein AB1286_31830 [Trinickia sp. NRRL B-1857]|uniref:hypothetical protein n=1 Tax=Trinickia sp. NRRL B-1857 TaxID=3162879 RepID=UPI003D279C49
MTSTALTDAGLGLQGSHARRETFEVRCQAIEDVEADAVTAQMKGAAVQEPFAQPGADAGSLLTQRLGHRLVPAIEKRS